MNNLFISPFVENSTKRIDFSFIPSIITWVGPPTLKQLRRVVKDRASMMSAYFRPFWPQGPTSGLHNPHSLRWALPLDLSQGVELSLGVYHRLG